MPSNLFGSGSNHRSADQVKADQDARKAADEKAGRQEAGAAAGRHRRSI